MRYESLKIEPSDSIDDVIYEINNAADYKLSIKLAKKFVKDNITKEMLEKYLEEKEFDEFGHGHEFYSCTELAAEYLYDYARFFTDYDYVIEDIYRGAVARFPKPELIIAIKIMSGKDVPKNTDMYTVREIAAEAYSDLTIDDYDIRDGIDDDIIAEIENVFNKWIFKNN